MSPTGVGGDEARSTDPEAQGDRDRWVLAARPLPLALPLGADSGSEEEPRFFLFTAAACLTLFCSTSPSYVSGPSRSEGTEAGASWHD